MAKCQIPSAPKAEGSSGTDLLKLARVLYSRAVDPVDRPFLADLALAVGLLCAWLLLYGFQPVVGAAKDEFRLVVRPGDYSLRWALGPAILGIAGLALAWLRHSFFSGSQLQERLRRAALLAAALLILRLAALLDPLVYVFPFLTLLWSPHALWAVALVFLGYVHLPPGRKRTPFPAVYVAGGLLALCLPLYFLYALYFCQVTMLHGDEGQYLRVTQSLLHDGDMDLANNLEQTDEFHVRGFAVHKAPGSPEDKVHSVHPIGLSAALLPAYWWGLDQWENPRLASALFIASLASLCVPLLFLYLMRLGAEPWAALLATCIVAVTGPFFHYSNQLYPEVPGLLIILITLVALAHWQLPGDHSRSWGAWEPPSLGLLTLLLCILPFLHPRLAPAGLICGLGVLLQAWHSPRRYLSLSIVGLVVAAGLWAVVTFNYSFSGDWLGPFRPGSAWGEGALDVATWKISLPGHWLHVDKGILNSSPVYFFSLLGLLSLAHTRDRRVVAALGIYAATAAVHGLHPGWTFGYGFPARFLVTALPVLVLGLAWAFPLLRTATITFFVAFSLVISLESVLDTLVLPEWGFEGGNLLHRSINHFYPVHQHFFPGSQQDIPLLDLAFWGLLWAALVSPSRHFKLRCGLITSAALAPFLWGRSEALADRLPHSLSPYVAHLTSATSELRQKETSLRPHLRLTQDATQPDGGLHARPDETKSGFVNSSLMGTLNRGSYRLTFPGLRIDPHHGQVSGHFIIAHRYTVGAVAPWTSRSSFPLVGGAVSEDYSLTFKVDQPSIVYTYCEYSGHGEVALDGILATFTPEPTGRNAIEIHRVSHESQERPIQADITYFNLPAGHYRVGFDLNGSTFATAFRRHPAPIKTAVLTGPVSKDQLEEFSAIWFALAEHGSVTVSRPDYLRPLQEELHPPWWLSIPFTADHPARNLRFALTQPGDVRALLHYAGPADLDLIDVVLYRETPDKAKSM